MSFPPANIINQEKNHITLLYVLSNMRRGSARTYAHNTSGKKIATKARRCEVTNYPYLLKKGQVWNLPLQNGYVNDIGLQKGMKIGMPPYFCTLL
jgi:hypothetical protein